VGGSCPPDHLQVLRQGRHANAGQKVRPVLTEVPAVAMLMTPVEPGSGAGSSSSSTRSFGRARVGCSRGRCRPRSTPTSSSSRVRRRTRPTAGPAAQIPTSDVRCCPALERGGRAADQRSPHRPRHRPTCRFFSVILPPWCRKTPNVCGLLPLLYSHGLPTGDFVPRLGVSGQLAEQAILAPAASQTGWVAPSLLGEEVDDCRREFRRGSRCPVISRHHSPHALG
jgi:hypothetical protein